MKKLFSTLLAMFMCASLISAFSLTVMAEESQEEEVVIYDLGTEGIINCPNFPDSYKDRLETPGFVEQVVYENAVGMKYFNVYLPYGYEDNDNHYNVLYLIHGGDSNPESFLRTDQPNSVSTMFDHMFTDGTCEPCIIVAVSWHPSNDEETRNNYSGPNYSSIFAQDELPNFIIPYIDEHYRTIPDREHRAVGGFSAGGVTTWNVLMYDMKDFATFIPMSGSYGMLNDTDGSTAPAEIAATIADAITAQGMTSDDFRIYAATSPADFAYPGLAQQMLAMKDNDMFKFGENTFFALKDGILHGDPMARHYLYVIMPMIW